eukprot:Platyproteum_vivax@DN4555_c0_g1_i2.p1
MGKSEGASASEAEDPKTEMQDNSDESDRADNTESDNQKSKNNKSDIVKDKSDAEKEDITVDRDAIAKQIATILKEHNLEDLTIKIIRNTLAKHFGVSEFKDADKIFIKHTTEKILEEGLEEEEDDDEEEDDEEERKSTPPPKKKASSRKSSGTYKKRKSYYHFDPKICDFCNVATSDDMTTTIAQKCVNDHIKKHNLKCENNKMFFMPDEALKVIYGSKKKKIRFQSILQGLKDNKMISRWTLWSQ